MALFEVRDLTPAFGAKIIGYDPARHWTEEGKALLRKTFDDRGLLIFPDVDVDFEFQDRLCRLLIGDEGPGNADTRPERRVSNKEEDGLAPAGRLMFHADAMWNPEQFRVLSLYALTVEPGSARTFIADSAVAWRELPAELKAQLEGRHAKHQTGQVWHRGGDDLARPQRTQESSSVKPLPNLHPDTGEPLLYVSQQMTHNIVELPEDESEALLMEVFDHLYREDKVYAHEWHDRDLLIADNIRMQHAREDVTYDGPTRTLRKVIAPMPAVPSERPVYVRPKAVAAG